MPVPPAPPELARRGAVHIVQRLRDSGHDAYLAGGCVRDELLGLSPTDYDVATDAPPDRVEQLFSRASHVGKSFGVVIVRLHRAEGFSVPVSTEVATFRTEGTYSDARRPDSVEFTDARTDAQRRDFTINALFIDPLEDDRVIDYVRGTADLQARVIRAVGEPRERLAEDHLRALRAVRFAARLGFEIEPETARAVREDAAELRGVSVERVGDELRRVLTHPSRARGARLLDELALTPAILANVGSVPNPADGSGILVTLPIGASLPAALAAWAIGLWPELEPDRAAAALRRACALSNEAHAGVQAAITGWRSISDPNWPRHPIALRKRQFASPWCPDALDLLRATDAPAADLRQQDRDRLASTPGGLAPTPWMTGQDLIEMGAHPGPAFRRVLDRVYDAQLETPDSGVLNRDDALSLARSLIRPDTE